MNDNQPEERGVIMTESSSKIYYLPPKTLADYNPDMLGKIRDYKIVMMHFIHGMAHGTISDSEYGRQLVRQYLCELPELVEEVRILKPSLLEM